MIIHIRIGPNERLSAAQAVGGSNPPPPILMGMTDDPIRTLLASIPPQPFWVPKGQTAILEEKVIEAGGDRDAVERWVEAHGGRLDRTVPVGHRSVLSREPVPDVQRFFVVPDDALAADAAAA